MVRYCRQAYERSSPTVVKHAGVGMEMVSQMDMIEIWNKRGRGQRGPPMDEKAFGQVSLYTFPTQPLLLFEMTNEVR